VTIGDEYIPAQTRIEHADRVLEMAARSVCVLTQIVGLDPQMLRHQVRREIVFI